MIAISDLNRLGSAISGSVSIRTGSISAHDLNTWMVFQPVLKGLFFAIGKDIDHDMPLKIDEYGSIAIPLFPRKIIYT
jgi:hypothetical protein